MMTINIIHINIHYCYLRRSYQINCYKASIRILCSFRTEDNEISLMIILICIFFMATPLKAQHKINKVQVEQQQNNFKKKRLNDQFFWMIMFDQFYVKQVEKINKNFCKTSKQQQKKIESLLINHLFLKKSITFMKMALLSHNEKVVYQKELTKNQQQSKMISLSDIQFVSQDILQRYTNNMRMQSKQQLIQIKSPQISIGTSQHSKLLRKTDLKKWLSEVCHSVFSIAYNSFKKSQMSEQEMKIYCSENLLLNLIKLSENNILAVEDYEYIDKVLKNDILSYYKDKYPPTLQKQSYKKFKAEIQQIDNMEELPKQLVKTSKLYEQFGKRYAEYRYQDEKTQYYDLIMQFINFCLQLPDKKHETNQQDGKSYYDEFRTLITDIFSKIEDINFMRGKKVQVKSQKSNKTAKQKENTQRNILKNQNENYSKEKTQEKIGRSKKQIEQKKITQIQKSQKEIQQQQQYRQKVKKYTHYKIGRKIPQHIHKFTEQQIKDQNITIKDPSLLRFLTKWLQQLEGNLENIQSKLKQVNNLNQQKTKKIKSQRKQLMKVYQNKIYKQQHFCDYFYLDSKQIYQIPKNDKLVGVFSCIASQHQSTFILKSINSIIGDLCSLTYLQPLDSFITQSVTCKIGDLIRCKCSSEQKQILKIYQQLKNYSRQNPQIFKIVRTKNRLQKGTRDILINILFRDTILCQIQLQINQDQSSQIILNSFNHYLYQLQRSKFGPIIELANVWTKDQRYGHIAKILENKWEKKVQNQCECKVEMKQQKNPFPFICSYCDRYYDKNNCFVQHKKCLNCKIWKCSYCALDEILENKAELLKEYSQRDDCQLIKLGIQNVKIPQYGMFICKTMKTKNFIEFKSFDTPNNIYLVGVEENVNKIIDMVCKDKQEQFFHNKIVFSMKKIDQLQALDTKEFMKTLLLPKNIKALYKNQSENIKLLRTRLNNQQFENITKGEKKNYQNIKFLNLTYNEIQEMGPILTRFKNLQSLNLIGNKIQQIPKEIENMNNLTTLLIAQNRIKTIHQSFGSLKNLITLELFYNCFQTIPQQLTNLKNLKTLVLSHNQIKTIPQQFANLQNLTTLDISGNKIKTIHKSFGNLQNLTTLKINWNQIETIPQQLTNLKNLTTLNIGINKIKTIDQSFGNLQNLTTLDISINGIETISQSFGNLKSLTTLNISLNKIETIPQSFGNLSSLTTLDISQNKIGTIPQSFGKLSSLTTLYISQNKIGTIPQSFGNLKSLTTLVISQNKIGTIPQSFGKLSSLLRLDISSNQMETIPKFFENFHKLQQLRIQKNKIGTIPQSICKLGKLYELRLSSNKINLTRQVFQLLMRMKAKIFIKQNEISLSQQDRKWIQQNKLDRRIFF